MRFSRSSAAMVLSALLALSAPPAFAQDSNEPPVADPSAPAPDVTPPPPRDVPPDAQNFPQQDEDQPPSTYLPEDQTQAPPSDYGSSDNGPTSEYGSTNNGAPDQTVMSPDGSTTGGQWVFTDQYGWVWMPYAQGYTYVVPGGNPYMFVFSLGLGWHWVIAPWIYGFGPRPYWGYYGPRPFFWYRHPWFSVPRYWGGYGYRGHTYYGGPRFYGHGYSPGYHHAVPVPVRPGPRVSPGFHGAIPRHLGGGGVHAGHRR